MSDTSTPPANSGLLELSVLRAELESDIMLCTTREQHIRLVTRINRLDSAIDTLRAVSC